MKMVGSEHPYTTGYTVARKDHNGFRDRPNRPLWHLSDRRCLYQELAPVLFSTFTTLLVYKRLGANWYNEGMPRISEFFGIVIKMYYNDHSPPHFHAEYGEFETIYTIETIEVLRGEIPRRAHAMVLEWTTLHRFELQDNWELARKGLPINSIDPLE
jgi:hypothetical protein